MNDTEINDIRSSNDFKIKTFSDYKKTDVTKAFLNSLVGNKVEEACNWGCELICSGHYSDLWEVIIKFICKYIHLGNPKLPIYIEMRFNKFKEIMLGGYVGNELSMRNNEKIRKLFAEIIVVLCYSRRKHSFEAIKIEKEKEFDISFMASKLKAPNVDYAKESFYKDDPKELFIAINEFAYHVSQESKNIVLACYWIEWIIEFEKICSSKKIKCICERRLFAPVNPKYQMDIIWIIWDVLLKQSNKIENNKVCEKILKALLSIFSIKYSNGSKKRRKYLLYFAVALMIEKIDLNVEIINDKKEIDIIVSKINIIYKQLKKNEIAPKTDYLFNGIEKSNIDKTIEKLEIMKNVDIVTQ